MARKKFLLFISFSKSVVVSAEIPIFPVPLVLSKTEWTENSMISLSRKTEISMSSSGRFEISKIMSEKSSIFLLLGERHVLASLYYTVFVNVVEFKHY